MSKKLQDKQAKRLAAQQRRAAQRRTQQRGNYITIAVAVVVVGLTVGLILSEREGEGDRGPIGVAAAQAGCGRIQEHDIEGQNHQPVGTDIRYETSPPTSGDHWPPEAVATTGFHDERVDEESLVHNLEHSQIVIWYDPDAPQEELDAIETFADDNREAVVAAPFNDIEEPNTFTATAWGASQSCERFSSEAIEPFRSRFQGRGPEPIAPPFGG